MATTAKPQAKVRPIGPLHQAVQVAFQRVADRVRDRETLDKIADDLEVDFRNTGNPTDRKALSTVVKQFRSMAAAAPEKMEEPKKRTKRTPKTKEVVVPRSTKKAAKSKQAKRRSDPLKTFVTKVEPHIKESLPDEQVAKDLRLYLETYREMTPTVSEDFYPYPAVTQQYEKDGEIIPIIFLGSANIVINGKLYTIGFQVDGKPADNQHPLLAKDALGSPFSVSFKGKKGGLPPDEERHMRAFHIRDGMRVRYWLHQAGGSDVAGGHWYGKVRENGQLVELTKEEWYSRQ